MSVASLTLEALALSNQRRCRALQSWQVTVGRIEAWLNGATSGVVPSLGPTSSLVDLGRAGGGWPLHNLYANLLHRAWEEAEV